MKKIIILLTIAISIVSVQLHAQNTNKYKWTKVGNIKGIIEASPLYDDTRVNLEESFEPDDERIQMPMPTDIHNAKMFSKGDKIVLMGQNITTGLLVFISNDKGKNWELLYSEMLDSNYTISDLNQQNRVNARTSYQIFNQSFLVSENKLIIPRYGDIFYSNLSDTNKIIEIPNYAPNVDSAYWGGHWGVSDSLIYGDFRTTQKPNPKNIAWIFSTSNYGETWDTLQKFNSAGKFISIIPRDNGNHDAFFLQKQITSDPGRPLYYKFFVEEQSKIFPLPEITDKIEDYNIEYAGSCITHIDENNGWLVGSSKYKKLYPESSMSPWITYTSIFYTPSGGLWWQCLTDSLLTIESPSSISFAKDGLNGLLVVNPSPNDTILGNDMCPLYRTADGGKTWFIDSLPGYNQYNEAWAACQTSSTTAVFFDAWNDIYFGELDPDGSIPEPAIIKNYSLFPNPASNDCTLSMDMTEAGSISVSLSDILGRDIMQIYDGYADAGTFTKTFNTRRLTSGMYFLNVRSGDESRTKGIAIY